MGGTQRAGGLEAPFTGRDVELRGLKDLFHAGVDRRAPRLVVVSGQRGGQVPLGLGAGEVHGRHRRHRAVAPGPLLVLRGRHRLFGLAEIVRQRFGIAEEDPTEAAAQKLKEGVVRFVPDEAERDYVGVRLSRLLGVPYASEAKVVLSPEELFAGWRLFFERLAQVAPVVVLVEDAQHADESLLGFFEHLVDWTRDLPIFVVLFARPGLPVIDAGYGVGRNRSTLSLDPLDDASMAALVEALVPGMPARARDTITARAEGIALFAVETVRSLIDKGVVQRDEDSYRLVGDLGELSVPGSLHTLLAGRLDALPPQVRALVADASVLGTSFPKDALVAVSGTDEGLVQAALTELVKRDVLQVFADPLSPERGAYRFSQEMLRQVAYETLSKKDRKSRHLAVARHLRATFANDGEEVADAVAHHYLDALATGPHDPDAEEVTGKALGFLVKRPSGPGAQGPRTGGEELRRSRRHRPYRPGGRASREPRRRAPTTRFEAAIAHADAARERYFDLGDVRGAARAQSLKGNVLGWSGRHGAARTDLTEALEVLRPVPDQDPVTALDNLATSTPSAAT